MDYPLYLASVLALGITAQWVAWRLKLPAIVLLLLFGLLLGKIADTQSAEGLEAFNAMVSLAVGIILFEGGMTLNFREIKETRGVVFGLVSVGLIITWLLTSFFAYSIGGFSREMSYLLGALLTVSGPTVILPLLQHVQPVRRIGSLAKWEGIVNDPIGAVLAALVFELVLHGHADESIAAHSLFIVGRTLIFALLLSGLGAFIVLQLLRRYLIPDSLQNPFILSLVLLMFAISNHLQSESGLVTVTLMGLALANQSSVAMRHIVEFKENLRVLLISTLFIVLASKVTIDMEAIQMLGWRSLALLAVMILVIRPIAVFVSTLSSGLTWQERVFLCWVHPRGIVAAAVSSLFALEFARVLGPEHPLAIEAERFLLMTFLVIMGTISVYGLTLGPLARSLGLSGANPQGIIFAGASPMVREIALAVQAEKLPVLLVDTNQRNNAAARMAGLPMAYASIGSEFIQEEIDLGGIGRLLAMTPNEEVNTLAAQSFIDRFGRAEVYQLAVAESSSDRTKKVGAYRQGRTLFDQPTTYEQLQRRFATGSTIKKTTLTTDFTFEDFLNRYGESALLLFYLEEGGKLTVATVEQDIQPKPGHKLIALVEDVEEPENKEAKPKSKDS